MKSHYLSENSGVPNTPVFGYVHITMLGQVSFVISWPWWLVRSALMNFVLWNIPILKITSFISIKDVPNNLDNNICIWILCQFSVLACLSVIHALIICGLFMCFSSFTWMGSTSRPHLLALWLSLASIQPHSNSTVTHIDAKPCFHYCSQHTVTDSAEPPENLHI